jgi:quercetin dioxygenase-like cupin family protein
MGGHSGSERLSFLGKRLSPTFEMRVIAVAAGCERQYHDAEWRDAIVIVERGEIDLESSRGRRLCFRRGDVLWLIGLPLRALHNRRREPAVLVALSRRGERIA